MRLWLTCGLHDFAVPKTATVTVMEGTRIICSEIPFSMAIAHACNGCIQDKMLTPVAVLTAWCIFPSMQDLSAETAAFTITASLPGLDSSKATHVTTDELTPQQQKALTSPGSTVDGWPVSGALLFESNRAVEQRSAQAFLQEFMAVE
jgi:hypothetical protein